MAERHLCTGIIALGALIVGVAIGIITMMPKPYGVDTIAYCNRRIDHFVGLPASERARIERIRAETPALETEWRVIQAIAGVIPAEDER